MLVSEQLYHLVPKLLGLFEVLDANALIEQREHSALEVCHQAERDVLTPGLCICRCEVDELGVHFGDDGLHVCGLQYEKDSDEMPFLDCVAPTVFVGAVDAREGCAGPHLCAGLDKSVAHRVGGLSTLIWLLVNVQCS
jgi:hypothetical protein